MTGAAIGKFHGVDGFLARVLIFMKSEFLHEIALAEKACEIAIKLGKLAGFEARSTTGYCAIAATWLARQINLTTPGRAKVVVGIKNDSEHAWVVLDNDWVLDPTNEQFDAKEPVFWGSIEESEEYIDLPFRGFDRWPAWQKPLDGAIENFGKLVKQEVKPEYLFSESAA